MDLNKIRSVFTDHNLDRVKLELEIETTPRDSRYSSNLIALMQKEELSLRESQSCPAELSRRIDEALSLETRKFFNRSTQANIKRWILLEQRFAKEREKKRVDISTSVNILDMEEARLEEEYNKNWFSYEGFHLHEAFNSQAAKVDIDWDVHEKTITDDYKMKKSQLTGKVNAKSKQNETIQSPTGKWQHPEKQKTLIHTAPVLSPTKRVNSDINGIYGRGKMDECAIQQEIDRLDSQYQSSMRSLQRQKSNAIRWMSRQKIRLISQAEEIHHERVQIGDILHKQNNHFKHTPTPVIV